MNEIKEELKLTNIKNKPMIFEKLIISHNNSYLDIWEFIHTIFCLTSSYIYAYVANFGLPEEGSTLYHLDTVFEVSFIISIILNFITDYVPDDNLTPVKDFRKIAVRYIKGDFTLHIIPVIPWHKIFTF